MSYVYIIVLKSTSMVLKVTWSRKEADRFMDNLDKTHTKYVFNEVLLEPKTLYSL